jgi:hypothetical protein
MTSAIPGRAERRFDPEYEPWKDGASKGYRFGSRIVWRYLRLQADDPLWPA